MQPPRLLSASEASRLGLQEMARREALTRIYSPRGPVSLVATAALPAMAMPPLPVAALNAASIAA